LFLKETIYESTLSPSIVSGPISAPLGTSSPWSIAHGSERFLVSSVRAVGFRGCRKSRLTQVSSVGAHSRAPYNPLTNSGLWAHSCAPLPVFVKVKLPFSTPSLACGPIKGDRVVCPIFSIIDPAQLVPAGGSGAALPDCDGDPGSKPDGRIRWPPPVSSGPPKRRPGCRKKWRNQV